MKPFRNTSQCLLPVCLGLLLVLQNVSSSNVTSTTLTSPGNVDTVNVLNQTETTITLSWRQVDNITKYFLKYENNGNIQVDFINESSSEEDLSITHVVSSLTSGKKYNFTLITTSDGQNSTGYPFDTFTAPSNPQDFREVDQTQDSITLRWKRMDGIHLYRIEFMDGSEVRVLNVSASTELEETKKISDLKSMTKYNFTLFSVFENISSSGVDHSAFTAPPPVSEVQTVDQTQDSITLQWKRMDGIHLYRIEFMNESEVRVVNVSASTELEVTKEISDLKSMTKYNFTLFSVFENIRSIGVDHSAFTAPLNPQDFRKTNQTQDSITLRWKRMDGIHLYQIEFMDGSEVTVVNVSASTELEVTKEISDLKSMTKYNFTLFSVFENISSSGVDHSAFTAPLNPQDFRKTNQNQDSITLRWKRMDGIHLYRIEFMDGSEVRVLNVSASTELEVTKEISDLKSMTKYNFTLFSVFENIRSIGVDHSAFTAPLPVSEVQTVDQNETSITLQWRKVTGIDEYNVQYNREEANISTTVTKEPSTYVIHGLSSGTAYLFKIFALFQNIPSREITHTAATVPCMVHSVRVTNRTVTSLTLSWDTEEGKNWTYTLDINGKELPVAPRPSIVSITIGSLQPGTAYPFSVTTVFRGLNSMALKNFTVTKIDCAGGTWNVTDSSIHGEVEGLFTYATASNVSQDSLSQRQTNLSFTDLYPGATYEVALFYERDYEVFEQCRHQLTILPSNIVARCKYWAAGYSIFVVWDKPYGVWTAVEVSVRGQNYIIEEDHEQSLNVSGFLPARKYEVSVALLSGPSRKSEPYVFSCFTDPRGVIAGSFFAVLIFLLLVCLTVFILLRRPDIISRRKSFIGGSKGAGGKSHKKSKPISVAKFPEHLFTLSADENRGFSLEYETLVPVGTEQMQRVALLPENKPRNRFVNIQPYDWCRVKLSTPNPNMFSDYINASYLPGYNHSREYIATQGPLPTTVNDFWRMIWEQKVKGIVMVTNCVEGGRTKCEKYWPADGEDDLYGDLLVTTRSELEAPSWTLREFNIKHGETLEERTVKHFHFTAWPDHGVPEGTEVLIQFRSLLRHHIQTEGAGTPTVVHCSAGVGRTGTIIALDVLLQQLESEKAVDINAFVHKMRLCRPHMVQTESQYVFLHQCIMDSLQSKGTEDNIYENTDTIYMNATALKALNSNVKT